MDVGVEVKGHFKLRLKLGEALWGALQGFDSEEEADDGAGVEGVKLTFEGERRTEEDQPTPAVGEK